MSDAIGRLADKGGGFDILGCSEDVGEETEGWGSVR